MKKSHIVGLVAICLVCIYIGGRDYYLWLRVKPIVDSPAARIAPTHFAPKIVGETKTLNLGYVRITLPESVPGELVHFADSNVIGLAVGSTYPLVFFPPLSKSDPGSEALFKNYARLSHTAINTWFELEKCSLSTRPIGISQLPALGIREFKARLSLLTLKYLEYSTTLSVQLFEKEHVGAVICHYPEFTMVRMADIRAGTLQNIMIGNTIKDIDEVVSAMLCDYEIVSAELDDRSIGKLVNGLGLREVPSGSSVTPAETQRLQDAIKEVIGRRIKRASDGSPVPVAPADNQKPIP